MSDRPLQYSHSGRRYLLGYGESFFGIWDRRADGEAPVHRFPRDDAGWREAWLLFRDLEPENVSVGLAGANTSAGTDPADAALIGALRDGDSSQEVRERIHPAWWSLPLLFGLLGGLIAWGRNRRRHPEMAVIMLLLGLASSGMAFYVYVQALGPTAVG